VVDSIRGRSGPEIGRQCGLHRDGLIKNSLSSDALVPKAGHDLPHQVDRFDCTAWGQKKMLSRSSLNRLKPGPSLNREFLDSIARADPLT